MKHGKKVSRGENSMKTSNTMDTTVQEIRVAALIKLNKDVRKLVSALWTP